MATLYIDKNKATGTLTGTLTFTNASTAVSASGGAFTSELAAGDYISLSTKTEWYKIASITNDDNLVLDWNFAQSNVTDSANASVYNSENGTATGNAWCHLRQATTDAVRSAGDIIKVRANQTHTYSSKDIVTDEVGADNNHIEVRGCTSADDPWSDGSDVKPIIDFNDSDFQFNSQYQYWKFKNLEFIRGSDSTGMLYFYRGLQIVENCVFRDYDSTSTAQGALGASLGGKHLIKDCQFYDNGTGCSIIFRQYGALDTLIDGCTFNAGSGAGTDTGIIVDLGRLFIKDTIFSQTTEHRLIDIDFDTATIFARNCSFKTGQKFLVGSHTLGFGGRIYSEDHNQVAGAHYTEFEVGKITKDTGVTRGGGASSSAKMEVIINPNKTTLGYQSPVTLTGNYLSGDFKIWCPASATTVTIHIRSVGVWSTYPTASELYVEADYLSSAPTRSIVVSNDVLTDESTWVAFDVTFTPNVAGWAYITVYLKKYEANKGCYVDIKPVVS